MASEFVVDRSGDVESGGVREVWLLRPDVSGLVSVGTLEVDQTVRPARGLGLGEFLVVDVGSVRHDGGRRDLRAVAAA